MPKELKSISYEEMQRELLVRLSIDSRLLCRAIKSLARITEELQCNALRFLNWKANRCITPLGTGGGITDDQRRAVFNQLEGEWPYMFGYDWRGITDEQRHMAFNRLESE